MATARDPVRDFDEAWQRVARALALTAEDAKRLGEQASRLGISAGDLAQEAAKETYGDRS